MRQQLTSDGPHAEHQVLRGERDDLPLEPLADLQPVPIIQRHRYRPSRQQVAEARAALRIILLGSEKS